MILQASVFSWISSVLSLLCLVWLVGLGLFVLVRSIVLKVKAKKEMKEDLDNHKNMFRRKHGCGEEDDYE